MFDNIDIYLNLKEKYASGDSPLKAKFYVPFDTPADASEVTFKGFGVSGEGESFRTGWELTPKSGSKASTLLAYSPGSIKFDTSTGTPRIILSITDCIQQLIKGFEAPSWFPFPKYVIYSNVDKSATQAKIQEYLERKELDDKGNVIIDRVANLNILAQTSGKEAAEFAQAFVEENAKLLPSGIDVDAGAIIGSASTSSTLSISMQVVLDNTEGLFLDPAIYLENSYNFFENLNGHPLESLLTKPFAGPIANGTIRYIKKDGTKGGDYTSSSSPANSINLAIEEADDYDTILILDDGTYYSENNENIKIDKPINITSLYTENVIVVNSETEDETEKIDAAIPSKFPKLYGKTETDDQNYMSVILIDEVEGIVSLCNLEIYDGRPALNSDNSLYGGGGIFINKSNETFVRNCYIHNNIVLPDEDNSSGKGYGGGIFCYDSSAYLYKNYIINNESSDRGGGIGVYGFGWPVIDLNIITENKAYGTNRGDGGGIGMTVAQLALEKEEWEKIAEASIDYLSYFDEKYETDFDKAKHNYVKILNNKITSNHASDGGGGIYASAMTYLFSYKNIISENIAEDPGGGYRITYGSYARIANDRIENNKAKTLLIADGDIGYGGGGVSIQCSVVILENTSIKNNIACNLYGGGVFVQSEHTDWPLDENDEIESLLLSWLRRYDHEDTELYKLALLNIYEFSRCEVYITGNESLISENISAMYSGSTDNRMGGGLCIRRHDEPILGSLPIYVNIENYIEVVKDNLNNVVFDYERVDLDFFDFGYTSESTLYPNADNIYAVDLVNGGTPIDDTNVSTQISGTTFEYTTNP